MLTNDTKTKYRQSNKNSKSLWLWVLLVGFLIFVAVSLGNALASVKEQTGELSKEIQEQAKQTEKLHSEFESLRNDYSQFKTDTETKQQPVQQPVSAKPSGPTPTQRPVLSGGNRGEIEAYILAKFGASGPRAIKIAICESGVQEHGRDGSAGERGVFQIHPVHARSMTKHGFTWDQMYNYKANVDYAFLLFTWQGWKPWTCSYKV